jgi:hypothetical protein
MGSRGARPGVWLLAGVAAVALVTGTPSAAGAATEYDGDATALRVEGLRLEIFPDGTKGLPAELRPLVDALKELQSQAPKELRRDTLTLALPDQVYGHVTFPGTVTEGSLPVNPLIGADAFEARSVEVANGNLVSEATVAGLSLGGGLLSAGVVETRCVGTGDEVGVDVSQLRLRSNQDIVDSEVALEPGQAVPIAGLGTVTFNQQDTDGSTYGEGTNVVIDLDSDLSLAALARMFDVTAPAVEDALKQVLVDVGETRVGPQGEQPLQPLLNEENVDRLQGGQVYDGFDQALDELDRQAPPEVRDALNHVADLAGTVTVSNAACSQATTVPASAPQQPAPQAAAPAAPAAPVADREPPLADTGAPAGTLGLGLAGLAALVGAGLALMRLRRRGA